MTAGSSSGYLLRTNMLRPYTHLPLGVFGTPRGNLKMRIILAMAALTACFSVWDQLANNGVYAAALQRNILGAEIPG
jgi:hypothetical protein